MKNKFFQLLAIASLCLFGGAAQAIDGSDVRIMVMQDDSGDGSNCVVYNSPAGKQVTIRIGEQFRRYGYVVVPREALAAELKFGLSDRLDKAALLGIAKKAKASGRAEFDIKALVVYRIMCEVDATSVATQIDAIISGSVYDTDARRELGDFGPNEQEINAKPNCDDNCRNLALMRKADDMALVIADQARTKLAMVTKQSRADGSSGRMVTYNVRLENMSKNSNRIRSTMEKQFPGSMGVTSLKNSGTLVTFGYKSSAPSDKINDWLQTVIDDLGLENIALEVNGTNISIRNDGSDMPAPKKPVERIFE